MAGAHKWICAVATVAVIAGFTVPVSAQTPLQCAGSANNPLIRAEDYTGLAGDIFVTCVGGVPAAPGALIPKVTITVFVTNTTITSKITDATLAPAFNEALLIVDEAGSVNSANSILNCGSATAPYGNVPFTCDTFSPNGDGTGDYDGQTNHPNVFQGRQVDNSFGQAIQFIGVPIDPPGPATTPFSVPTRTLRITNLRVNAAALNVYIGNPFSLTTINTTVSFNGTNFDGNPIVNVQNGTIRPALVVTGQLNASPQNFLQCSASPSVVGLNNITLTEGFPTAFRVRNWRQIQDNGIPPVFPGGDWTWNGGSSINPIDLNQNVPNALYSTESGLMFPPGVSDPVPGNPPPGTGSFGSSPGGAAFQNPNGIEQAGTASQGTRFAIRFSTIPAGSNPSVPLSVVLTAGTPAVPTGVMELVCGIDDAGAGGVPGSCTASAGAGFPGNTMLIPANGLVVYEVAFSNPNAIENASINVSVNPAVNLSANPPIGGSPQVNVTAQAVAGLAPFYAASTGAGAAQVMSPQLIAASPSSVPPIPASAPIPRFRNDLTGQTPISLYSYTPCAALTGLVTNKSGPANARDWTVSVIVTNPVTAIAAQITGLTLTQTFGPSCTPVIATSFPVIIGDLPAFAGSGHVTINFTGCSAIARFTAVLSFSATNAVQTTKTLFNQYR